MCTSSSPILHYLYLNFHTVTVHDSQLPGPEGEPLQTFIDVVQFFLSNHRKFFKGDDRLVVAEVGQIEYHCVDGLVKALPLADQEVLEVVELLLLKTGAFEHFGNDSRNVLAQQLRVPFGHQQLGQFALFFTEQIIFKTEVFDGMGDLMIQGLDFSLEGLEVLIDHFEQYVSFFLIGADICVSDILDILDGVAGVHLLALEVVLYAALGLADGTRRTASYATAQLDRPQRVQTAECVLFSLHQQDHKNTHSNNIQKQRKILLIFFLNSFHLQEKENDQQNPMAQKAQEHLRVWLMGLGTFWCGVELKS